MKKNVLVVLSGGQDSTTCLFWARSIFKDVHAVTFNYGQRHAAELMSARVVAFLAAVKEHFIVPIGPILESVSPLVSDTVLDQYESAEALPGGLEKTFVPGRNMLFLLLAANYAYARGIRDIVTGVCQEDFGGYPDCRQDFIVAAGKALNEAFDTEFTIHTPLMFLTKAQAVQVARNLPGAWKALAYTHTAYDGQYPPTGKDHASLLRARGFLEAGLPDPLVLRAYSEGVMELPDTPNYKNAALLRPLLEEGFEVVSGGNGEC